MTILNDYRRKVQVKGTTNQKVKITERNDFFLDTFKDALEYVEVGLGSTSNTYDTWLYDNTAYKQFISEKTLILAPNQDLSNFFDGQYVYSLDSSDKWIIESSSDRYEFKPKAKIRSINSSLNWIDENGKYFNYDCVVDDKLSAGLIEDVEVPLSSNQIKVMVQQNTDTLKTFINQRFIFGKYIFEIEGDNNYANITPTQGLLTITMQKQEESEAKDDFVNNIAYNGYDFTLELSQEGAIEVQESQTHQLQLVTKRNGETINNPEITWSSLDESVATVSSTGLITGVAVGTTTITARLNPQTSIDITIDIVTNTVNVESFSITPDDRRIGFGQSENYQGVYYINGIDQGDTSLTITDLTQGSGYTFTASGNRDFTITNNNNYSGTVTIRIASATANQDFVFDFSYW